MRILARTRARRVALGAATAMLGLAALAGCDYAPDGDPDVVTMAGSDTTEDVMRDLANQYQTDDEYNPPAEKDTVQSANANEAGFSRPADEDCTNPPNPEVITGPNGSNAGRDALSAAVQAGNGCFDIARSSSGPRPIGTGAGQDLATFNYYAFGLDAVGWSSGSTLAPSSLTIPQLVNIFNCTWTNWSQVPGSSGAGPIQRYWPQAGSGTGSFAASSSFLGINPLTINPGGSCGNTVPIQENDGNPIPGGAGGLQAGIFVYSGGAYSAQRNNQIPDQTAGQVIRNLNDAGLDKNIIHFDGTLFELNSVANSGDPNAPVEEKFVATLDFPGSGYPAVKYRGIRAVFNVVDDTQVSRPSAIRYVGFDNVTDGSTSPLCSGGKAATVKEFGFEPLPSRGGIPLSIPATTCRVLSLDGPD